MKTQPEGYRAWVVQQAAEWFVENRGGPLSPLQRRAFVRWLQASPLHVAEYLAIAQSAKRVAAAASQVDARIDDLLAEAAREEKVVRLSAQGNFEPHSRPIPAVSSPRAAWWRPLSSVPVVAAVAVTVCVALAIGAWLWTQYPLGRRGSGVQYQTQVDQDRTVKLADDTVLYLTGNSAVRVRFDANRRLVDLERGQALFEVAHDAKRPFEVRAGNSVIEDIGTVFDVSRNVQSTVITVLNGHVAVWNLPYRRLDFSSRSLFDDGDITPIHRLRIDLNAGDQARILPTGAVRTSRPSDLAQTAPWFDPQITFNRESLANVVAEFNHHNRVQIEVTDPRIAAIPVSGVFHSYDIASFASFLNNLSDVRARMMDGHLQVSATADHSSSGYPPRSSLP